MATELENTITKIVNEIFQPKEEDKFADKNGKSIVTGKLVRMNNRRGKIKGVTIDKKVKVTWFFPAELNGKSSPEEPKNLEIY